MDRKKVQEHAKVLRGGMPYMEEFNESIFVIKYGGSALDVPETRYQVTGDIVLLSYVGIKPVIVHGGADEIDNMENMMGIKSEKKDGIRITKRTEGVIGGLATVNDIIVGIINKRGKMGVGISATSGRLINPVQYAEGYYQTGRINEMNPELVSKLIGIGCIPVISTYTKDSKGKTYNINADEVAGHLAKSLEAEKIIMLTNTPGILEKEGDKKTLISTIRTTEIEGLKEKGIISGGMMPKIDACVMALEGGVKKAHIIDGSESGTLVVEMLTKEGVGTEIILDSEK